MGNRGHIPFIRSYTSSFPVAEKYKESDQEQHRTPNLDPRLRQHSEACSRQSQSSMGRRSTGRRFAGAQVQLAKGSTRHHCATMALSFGAG